MLGKLVKWEFNATWRVMLPVLAAVLLLAAVAGLIMFLGAMLMLQPFMAVELVMRLFGALLAADGFIEIYFAVRIYSLRNY